MVTRGIKTVTVLAGIPTGPVPVEYGLTTKRDIFPPLPTWNDGKGTQVAACSYQTLIPPGQARWGRKQPPKIRDGREIDDPLGTRDLLTEARRR